MRLSTILALLAATPAAAQLQPMSLLQSQTVRAGNALAAPVLVGSDVWGGLSRAVTSSVGHAHLTMAHDLTSTRASIGWQLGGVANAPGDSVTYAAVRYELWAAQPVTARLALDWNVTAAGTGVATVAIDLHGDGSIDANGSAILPVTFGPGSLVVVVTASTQATAGTVYGPWGSWWSYAGSAAAALSLRIEATHATVQASGVGCGPSVPALAAAGNFTNGVDFVGTAPGNDLAILVLGLQPLAVALPLPPGCTLLVDAIATDLQWLASPQPASWSIAVPPPVRPFTFYGQLLGVTLTPLQIASSAALRVDVL